MRLTPKQIEDSFAAVQTLFRQARPMILAGAGTTAHTSKTDGTPATETDVAVENMLMDELERQFPGIPVLGEETGYDPAQESAAWLIDPIDGTKAYIQNIPVYTCMAALIQDGQTVASVIYNPVHDALYTAQKGGGAYKNGQRLDLRARPLPARAFCRERLLGFVNTMLAPTGVTCEAGPTGAGYGFSMVAEGVIAARFNFPHKPGGGYTHDYAPGALLVHEAGGAVVPIEGETYTYQTRSFVACHPALEALVRQHARQLRAAEIQSA